MVKQTNVGQLNQKLYMKAKLYLWKYVYPERRNVTKEKITLLTCQCWQPGIILYFFQMALDGKSLGRNDTKIKIKKNIL